jgi:hypothetical protein
MPIRIFLLGGSGFDKSDFLHKYSDWVARDEGKPVRNKRSDLKKGILIDSIPRDKYPWQTFIFKQLVDDKNRDNDDETIKALTQFPTAVSNAIVYFVKAGADKPENLVLHTKQAFQAQKKLDYADIHALRYLIITPSDLLNKQLNPEIVLAEFIAYAKSQGINKVFIHDSQNRQNFDAIFEEIDTVPEDPSVISSVLGYILFAVLGTASYFLFYNPVTAFLIACEGSRWNTITNSLLSLAVLISFPFWYPFIPVVESLLLNPGGYRGILNGLETPYYTIRNLLSDHFRSAIVSFIIIGFIAAAVLLTVGFFGPAVIGGVGLSALAVNGATSFATYAGISGLTIGGISALSTAGLAAIVGAVVGVACTVVYEVGIGISKAIHAIKNYNPAPPRPEGRPAPKPPQANPPEDENFGFKQAGLRQLPVVSAADIAREKKTHSKLLEHHAGLVKPPPLNASGRDQGRARGSSDGAADRSPPLTPREDAADRAAGSRSPSPLPGDRAKVHFDVLPPSPTQQ